MGPDKAQGHTLLSVPSANPISRWHKCGKIGALNLAGWRGSCAFSVRKFRLQCELFSFKEMNLEKSLLVRDRVTGVGRS